MSLDCDCYPGCWGDHSNGWPSTKEHVNAKATFLNMASNVRRYIQYGDYVRADGELRLESAEAMKKLEEFFGIAAKAILEDFASPSPAGGEPVAYRGSRCKKFFDTAPRWHQDYHPAPGKWIDCNCELVPLYAAPPASREVVLWWDGESQIMSAKAKADLGNGIYGPARAIANVCTIPLVRADAPTTKGEAE
jgi:hypothetical protein